jgi:hypothetical protein
VAVKARVIHNYSFPFFYRNYFRGDPLSTTKEDVKVFTTQVTDSYSHPAFLANRKLIRSIERGNTLKYASDEVKIATLRRLRNRDLGGMFYTVKKHSTLSSPMIDVSNVPITASKTFDLNGRFLPQGVYSLVGNESLFATSPVKASVMETLRVLGTTAINRTIPTAPEASLALTLGELYGEGLPSLVGSVLLRAKSIPSLLKGSGSEYLNVQFGWKPFVSDLKGLCDVVSKSGKILEQYEKGAGRPIGRRYEFPVERSTTVTESSTALYPPIDSTSFSSSVLGTRTVTTEVVNRYWFEGTYNYRLPSASSAASKVKLYASEADKLLGLRVTPEVLWNLAPWSWLSDWFLNYGTLISNFSNLNTDNCMLRRGYIMGHLWTRKTYSHPGSTLRGYGPTGTISQTFITETKARRRASPYGFGVTFQSFTPRQIAILAALGISRDWRWGLD